jgi:hypothetical protein
MSVSLFGFGTPAANDALVSKPYPAYALQGTEALGLYAEIREIAGAIWTVINATYVTANSAWTQVNTAYGSYATVQRPTGITQYAVAAGVANPFLWTVASGTSAFVGNISATGSIAAGSVNAFGLPQPGSLLASESASAGAIYVGGNTDVGIIDYGLTNAHAWTFSGVGVGSTQNIFGVGNLSMAGYLIPGNGGTVGSARIYSGAANPNGVVSAPNGSLFLNFAGAANAHLFINTSGANTTGTVWTAVTD